MLGPPGTGKTHLATALGIAAAHAGTASHLPGHPDGSPDSPEAHRTNRLDAELRKISCYMDSSDRRGRLSCLTPEVAKPVLPARRSRQERSSIILTPPTCSFHARSAATIASAMTDRIVHHADVIALQRASYRIKHTGNRHTALRSRSPGRDSNPNLLTFPPEQAAQIQPEPTRAGLYRQTLKPRRIHGDGGAGMSDSEIRRLTSFHDKLRRYNLVVELLAGDPSVARF